MIESWKLKVESTPGANPVVPTPQIVYGTWPVKWEISSQENRKSYHWTDRAFQEYSQWPVQTIPYEPIQNIPLAPSITINVDTLLKDGVLVNKLTAILL